eukprot:2055484-Amphidinium_carterae.1
MEKCVFRLWGFWGVSTRRWGPNSRLLMAKIAATRARVHLRMVVVRAEVVKTCSLSEKLWRQIWHLCFGAKKKRQEDVDELTIHVKESSLVPEARLKSTIWDTLNEMVRAIVALAHEDILLTPTSAG